MEMTKVYEVFELDVENNTLGEKIIKGFDKRLVNKLLYSQYVSEDDNSPVYMVKEREIEKPDHDILMAAKRLDGNYRSYYRLEDGRIGYIDVENE